SLPPGSTRVADAGDGGQLDYYRQRQKILFDQLRQDGLEAQRQAAEKFRSGQHEAALEQLQEYLARLSEEKLEPGQITLLRRPVESRLSHFRLLKAQNELAQGAVAGRQRGKDMLDSIQKAERMKQQNVEKLMKEFNALFKDGKYQEAESIAMRVLELDADNGVAAAAIHLARRQRGVT